MLILWTILGVFIRVIVATRERSLWYNEWALIESAQNAIRESVFFSPGGGYPPAYLIFLDAFMKLFGDHTWVLRFPSLVLGISTLIVLYLVSQKLFNKSVASITLYLGALSPFLVQLSSEVQIHGMPVFLCLLATYACLEMIDHPLHARWRWFYIGSSVLAINASHMSFFWLVGMALFHLLKRLKNPLLKRTFRYQILAIGLAIATTWIYMSYQALTKVTTHSQVREVDAIWSSPLSRVVLVLWNFFTGFIFNSEWNYQILSRLIVVPFFWVSVIFVILALVSIGRGLFATTQEDIKLFVFFFVVCILSIVLSCLFYPDELSAHHFAFAMPFMLMLLSYGLWNSREPLQMAVVICLFSTVGFFANADMARLPTDAVHEQNYIEMTKYVFWNAGPKDLIVGNENRIFEYYKKKYDIRSHADYTLKFDEVTKEKVAQYEHIWVLDGAPVESERFEPLRQRMREIGFYLKGTEYRFGGDKDFAAANEFQRIPNS